MSASRRAHARVSFALFAALGLHVGVLTVLSADLAADLDLSPGELGRALGVQAAAGIAALVVGGALVDSIGRRALAATGTLGLAAGFAALSQVGSFGSLVVALGVVGAAGGCLDLGANSVGSDYERAYRVRAMTRLHAGFSAAAAGGALLSGFTLSADVPFRTIYFTTACVLVPVGAAALFAALPSPDDRAVGGRPRGALELLRMPAVGLAAVLVTVCFLGDGALESYASLYLRDVLAAGALLGGAAIGAFHLASLAGRLVSASFAEGHGERATITAAGLLAAAAMTICVVATGAPLAALGLLLVGFALAPVIPTALSLAGRSAPGRSGAAVSLVTTVGYSAFVAGPPLVGALADVTSLRVALAPLVATMALIAVLARRLPA